MGKIWHKSYDEQVPRSIPFRDQTVYQLFQDSVDKNPQGIATLFFGSRIRYRELGNRVDRFASALASMGIGKGDRVNLFIIRLVPDLFHNSQPFLELTFL